MGRWVVYLPPSHSDAALELDKPAGPRERRRDDDDDNFMLFSDIFVAQIPGRTVTVTST